MPAEKQNVRHQIEENSGNWKSYNMFVGQEWTNLATDTYELNFLSGT